MVTIAVSLNPQPRLTDENITFSSEPHSQPMNDKGTTSTQGLEQTFLVHKEIIRYYSLFFDAAFNGKFQEGKTQSMILDDTDPQLFAVLVEWFYNTSTLLINFFSKFSLAFMAQL
jgi:hypothetical protein